MSEFCLSLIDAIFNSHLSGRAKRKEARGIAKLLIVEILAIKEGYLDGTTPTTEYERHASRIFDLFEESVALEVAKFYGLVGDYEKAHRRHVTLFFSPAIIPEGFPEEFKLFEKTEEAKRMWQDGLDSDLRKAREALELEFSRVLDKLDEVGGVWRPNFEPET